MIKLGYTFSSKYCKELNLDWVTSFNQLLQDFRPDIIRLCCYWDIHNPDPDKYDWSNLDQQLASCRQYGTEVIMAVGRKVPRWPEYYEPKWARGLTPQDKQVALEDFFKAIITRYDENPTIKIWQIENEPLYDFGISNDKMNEELLRHEFDLARNLTDKPLATTVSGEGKENYSVEAKLANWVGMNVYKITYNKEDGKYECYDFESDYYIKKMQSYPSNYFAAELQAEPWGANKECKFDAAESDKSASIELICNNYKLAQEIKFPIILFWGAEWWLVRKNLSDDGFYDELRNIFLVK